MGTLLMEALISSTTTSPAPGNPASEFQSPANSVPTCPSSVLNPESVSPEVAPANPTAAAPEIPVVDIPEDDKDEDDYLYGDDPTLEILNMLNVSVVHRKPMNILDTPIPPGEMIPKAHYLEEKKALHEMIKMHRQEVLKAQVDKLNEAMKVQSTEKKMQRVVKIIADLHHLYGQFLQSLVILMRKGQGRDGEMLLTIGPFQDVQEVDRLLVMLSGLSNHFQNDFENLSKTKQALTQVTGYLNDKAKSVLTSPSESVTTEEAMDDASFQGHISAADDVSFFSSEVPIPENEAAVGNASIGTVSEHSNATTNAAEVSEAVPPMASGAEVNESFAVPAVALPTDSSSSNTDNGNCTSAFVPVPDPTRPVLADGRTLYTLLEYPEHLNLVNKKHGFDLGRSKQGNVWFCLCNQQFPSLSLIKYHVRYFSAKWKFLCTLCSSKFPGLNFLKLHMLREHKIMYVGTHACSHCSKSFQTAGEHLRHMKTVHKQQLPADVDHMTGSEPLPCQTDPSAASTASTSPAAASLPSSSTSTAPIPSDPNVLVVHGTRCACGIELGTREALIAHLRSEVQVHGQSFKCTLCVETFSHPCSLKSHFREKHNMEYLDYEQRQYGCSCCDAMFESYEDLETHTVSAHQMDQEPSMPGPPPNDQLSIDDSRENTGENTMTFHVDASMFDDGDGVGTSFTLDPPVVTLED